MNKLSNYFSSIGRRKTSIAKVFLKNGRGIIKINEKPLSVSLLSVLSEHYKIRKSLILGKLNGLIDLTIFVNGGGISSQLEAISLATSKALCLRNNMYRYRLKKHLLLRSDSRAKETRKYGFKKARKAPQYSKR